MIKKNLVMSMAVTSAVLAVNGTEANAAEMGIVNTAALNVRSGAGTNYSIIDKLYRGNTVDILSTANGWYKVKLSNGTIGWASSQYINKENNSNSQTSPNTSKKGTVNTSALNVRSGAGTNYSIIGKLYKGNTVDILTNSNGWYKIKLSNSSTGWVSSTYITLGASSSNSTNNKPETPSDSESIKKG